MQRKNENTSESVFSNKQSYGQSQTIKKGSKEEILNLEKKFWDCMRNHDIEGAMKLTSFPCLLSSSHGARLADENDFRNSFKQHEGWKMELTDFSNDNVIFIDDRTAAISYEMTCEMISRHDETKIVRAAAQSVWVKQDSDWKCVAHSESEMYSPAQQH